MKKLIFTLASIATAAAGTHAATRPVNVADSTVSTVPGIGGYTEVLYKFAKGDKVTVTANASKMLERAMVVMLPQTVLIRIKDSKKINQTFEMPADGTVVFRFVSDRGGINNVRYSIIRLPATEETQNFDTQAATPSSTIQLHP